MDIRSFQLDFEVSLKCLGSDFLARLSAVEDFYRGRSRELTLAEWRQRALANRYLDNVMRLTSAVQ